MAHITEMLYFEPHGPSQATSTNPLSQELAEQVCIKVDLVFYEPLMSANNNNSASQQKSNKQNSSSNLFGKCFDNISIQINHTLVVELDISLIDRMYYLMNDISKCSSLNSSFRPPTSSHQNVSNNQTQLPVSIKNLEIKCSQLLKIALRFPIADLRQNKVATTGIHPNCNNSNSGVSSTLNAATSAQSNTMLPTMIAFKRLRPQVLTLHIFDFGFHTVLDNKTIIVGATDSTLLTFTTAQCNLYYQYTKKDRPIHFGLIQENSGEETPNKKQAILFSIKIPNNLDTIGQQNQGLGAGVESADYRSNTTVLGAGLSPEQDSLGRQILNRANNFYYGGSIKEEQLKENINLGIYF